MNKSKKIGAVLLALCMTLSGGSVLALAEETDKDIDYSQEYAAEENIGVGEVEFYVLNSGDDHVGEIVEDLYLAENAIDDVVKNMERVVNLKGLGVTKDNIRDLYHKFVSEHPGYFYITASCRYTYSMNSGEIINVYPKYITATADNYGEEPQEEIARQNEIIYAMKEKFDAGTSQLMSCITPEMSDVDKLLALHDALACHTSYSKDPKGEFESSIYTAYGAIVEKGGVCQSYSLAYQYLVNLAGIDSICTVTNDYHGWNMVKLNDQWYHIDVTFDDPTNDIYGRVNHNYFLISDNKLKANDKSTNHETWSPAYSATDTTYDGDSNFWSTTTSQIIYDEGNIYYNDMSTLASSSRAIGIIKKIAPSGEESQLAVIDDPWYANGGGYYTGNYTRMFKNGNYIYYNNSSSIMRVNVNDGTIETLYTLPEDIKKTNNINGITMGDNGIDIHYAASPTAAQSVLNFEFDFSEEEEPVYALGDVDKNGVIDINDVTYIQKYLAKQYAEIDMALADVDANGAIDIEDATILQKYIAGLIKF